MCLSPSLEVGAVFEHFLTHYRSLVNTDKRKKYKKEGQEEASGEGGIETEREGGRQGNS